MRRDVVIDTDAFNEIDDQFAISYLLRSEDKLNTVAIYAAPFHNEKSSGPADGMEKSYDEILKLLKLSGREDMIPLTFKGSIAYLPDEHTPVSSAAAEDLVERAAAYSPEAPLYVVAIGAITNIASAIIMKPQIAQNLVIVWLGGHARHYHDTEEFNMKQDYKAARVIFGSGAKLVQLPCQGVVSEFRLSKPEAEFWLLGKNPLADYLGRNMIEAADSYAKGKPWTRVIWDVTAVGWLLNEDGRFMKSRELPVVLPSDDGHYGEPIEDTSMEYVYFIDRDALMEDLIAKLVG